MTGPGVCMCKGRREAGMLRPQKVITLVSCPSSRAAHTNQVSSNVYPGGRFSKKQTPRQPPSATTLREEGSTQTRTPTRTPGTFWVQASATTKPAQTTPWHARLQQTRVRPILRLTAASSWVVAAPSLDIDGEPQGIVGGQLKAMAAEKLWLQSWNHTIVKVGKDL